MHRFYLPPDQCAGSTLRLVDREAHHAADVLRLRKGDAVVVLDGAGHEFSCTVQEAKRKEVWLAVDDKKFTHPLPWRLTLLQAIPKGKLFDFIIEKATELGAARIVPLVSERVIARPDAQEAQAKAEKWQHTAIEAIKQCGQPWLPRVETPVSPKEFLARGEKFDLALVGSLQADARHARSYFEAFFAANQRQPQSLAIWVGPEGDFSPGEMEAIKSAGARPITLGSLVLRCETAAMAMMTLVNYELQA